ncbi:MAG: hypothetical protein K6U12_05175 [Armatimonadetes bacterium]|nr:hypothetical protein [Armatimonadota bacterium]
MGYNRIPAVRVMPAVDRTVDSMSWRDGVWLSGSVGQPTNREAASDLQKDTEGFATPTAHGTAGFLAGIPRAPSNLSP